MLTDHSHPTPFALKQVIISRYDIYIEFTVALMLQTISK